MSTKTTGDAGEARAAKFLESKGFSIVATKYRSQSGEIDIIAENHGRLVFCEVKTWPHGDTETLEKALGKKKQTRIVETSKHFIAENRKYSESIVQFDVLLVDVPGFDEICHIENAFSEM